MDQLIEVLKDGPCHRDVLRVFSDALLERGDPWGEAIRLALDLEQRFPGEPEWIAGQRRLRRGSRCRSTCPSASEHLKTSVA